MRNPMSSNSRLRKFYVYIYPLILLTAVFAHAAQPYQPISQKSFKDKKRWAKQEITNQRRTVSVTSENDQSIWISYEDGHIDHYKGSENQAYKITHDGFSPRINRIFISSKNNKYAAAFNGLYLLENQNWKKITNNITDTLPVQPITEFSDGSLWYCHTKGIDLIKNEQVTEAIKTSTPIVGICEISKDKVWILGNNGAVLYEAKRNGLKLAPPQDWLIISKYSDNPLGGGMLFKDNDGLVWMVNSSTDQGAIRYDPISKNSVTFDLAFLGGDNYNNGIIQSPDGKIWVTGRSFLHAYNGTKWEVFDQSDNIPSSYRMVIDCDQKGFLYLVDGGNSLYRIDYGNQYWKQYEQLHYQDHSPDGSRWYISFEGNIICETPNGNWIEYNQEDQIIQNVLSVKTLNNGNVVGIGSEHEQSSLCIFNGKTWEKHCYPELANTFARDSFLELEDGSFLISSIESDSKKPSHRKEGILRFYNESGHYKHEFFLPEKAPVQAINIQQTSNGQFWVNYFGIKSFSETKDNELYRPPGWYHNWIEQMTITPDDTIWLSMWGMGIFSLKNSKDWQFHGTEQGLTTKSTNRLITLHDDTLLTSTDRGLFRYDHHTWFPFLDRNIEMQRDAGTLISERNSIWINNADSSWYDRWKTESYLTSNQHSFYTIRYEPDTEPPETLIENHQTIQSDSPDVTIKWSGRDSWSKTPLNRIVYSYRIDEEEWSPFVSKNEIQFNKLKDGKHSVEVRARDEDLNIDPSPAKIEIMVNLPFWMQLWFYYTTGAILLALTILAGIIIRLKVKHIQEMDELRNRFFVNLSHELRTPLSLLAIPVERMKKHDLGTKMNKDLLTMDMNIKRLILLIDQLLDFRSIEKGKVKIHPQSMDMVGFMRGLVEVFEVQAEEKRISLTFHCSHQICKTEIDPDLLQKIADNLISNAIKYTPEDGQIRIHLHIQPSREKDDSYDAKLVVEDNGDGIQSDIQNHIFEPFYRGKTDLSKKGYGIGLALVKELLHAINGSIHVESPIFHNKTERPGTRFSTLIPISTPTKLANGSTVNERSFNSESTKAEATKQNHDAATPMILLVEDNSEIRENLKMELQEHYHIIEASNGEEGIEKSQTHIPDLILADVMMPLKDGFELTEAIKENEKTAHIPVIIITALKSNEHHKATLHHGADDYIPKPVSIEMLNLKIRNLLQTRHSLADRVRQEYGIVSAEESINEHYKEFMDKTKQLIEENIDDPEFDVDILAQKTGMSRSGFYRKFRAVTGEVPATFIRSVRMKYAAQLIVESRKNMTEIALSVGYTEAANFSRSFKQFFDCPPSKYKQIHRQK